MLDSEISGNDALTNGGGVVGARIVNTVISNNIAGGDGGGSYRCTLEDCIVTHNYAGSDGGGCVDGTNENCVISWNVARYWGGGMDGGYAYNCALYGNTADKGGGAYMPRLLQNCTIVGNCASNEAGDSYLATAIRNSLIYQNFVTTWSLSQGWYPHGVSYSCLVPAHAASNNISSEPRLASMTHLSADSPCIGRGAAGFLQGTDIDGESWGGLPSMGCDEYGGVALTGQLTVTIRAWYTNMAVGFSAPFFGYVCGKASSNVWDLGDGSRVTNQLGLRHEWLTTGTWDVVLSAYNDSNPGGICSTVVVAVVPQMTHYVDQSSTNAVSPYMTWETAANNIQHGVDMCVTPGSKVVVAGGTYTHGGRTVPSTGGYFNCVVVTNAAIVESLGGAEVTAISGGRSQRCVYASADARITGFTLQDGSSYYGGGAYAPGATLSDCMLISNRAQYGAGAYGGTLRDCRIEGNFAYRNGGGVALAVLDHCVVYENEADDGGGTDRSEASACEIVGNVASDDGGGTSASFLNNCLVSVNVSYDDAGGANFSALDNCTVVGNVSSNRGGGVYSCSIGNTIVWSNYARIWGDDVHWNSSAVFSCAPDLAHGVLGNTTNKPRFADMASEDFRVTMGSPCIDAGMDAAQCYTNDLVGYGRPSDGDFDGTNHFDMGAYEYDPQTTDSDRDRMNDLAEMRADTDPTNSASFLACMEMRLDVAGLWVDWVGGATVTQLIQRCTDPVQGPWVTIYTNLPPTDTLESWLDPDGTNEATVFYRIAIP